MATRKRRKPVDTPEPVEEVPAAEFVRLIPTYTAYIQGEPAVERDVTPQEAARLLAFKPPAYTKAPKPAEVPADDEPPTSIAAVAADEPQE